MKALLQMIMYLLCEMGQGVKVKITSSYVSHTSKVSLLEQSLDRDSLPLEYTSGFL
jgi:hypothetical protein